MAKAVGYAPSTNLLFVEKVCDIVGLYMCKSDDFI
jgi:hypothetical protein